jgi:hypothetical protein
MAVTIWNGFAMEQAGEVDYLITWRDEFVGRETRSSAGSAARNPPVSSVVSRY